MTPTLAETIFYAAVPIIFIIAIVVYNIKKQDKENEQLFGMTEKEKKIYKEMEKI